MNPGFISIWIMLIIVILLATGWKSYLAPGIDHSYLLGLSLGIFLLLPMPLWWAPMKEIIPFELQAAVLLLLFSSLLSILKSDDWGYIGYLVLCVGTIMIIWGCLWKMYSADPVFYWLEPVWSAPIIAGILCASFTSQVKHQFAVVVWGLVLGEILKLLLQGALYTASIGMLAWWDSFWIAMAAARLFSVILLIIRKVTVRIGDILMYMKGGRSS